jgi:hypothetical protein
MDLQILTEGGDLSRQAVYERREDQGFEAEEFHVVCANSRGVAIWSPWKMFVHETPFVSVRLKNHLLVLFSIPTITRNGACND